MVHKLWTILYEHIIWPICYGHQGSPDDLRPLPSDFFENCSSSSRSSPLISLSSGRRPVLVINIILLVLRPGRTRTTSSRLGIPDEYIWAI